MRRSPRFRSFSVTGVTLTSVLKSGVPSLRLAAFPQSALLLGPAHQLPSEPQGVSISDSRRSSSIPSCGACQCCRLIATPPLKRPPLLLPVVPFRFCAVVPVFLPHFIEATCALSLALFALFFMPPRFSLRMVLSILFLFEVFRQLRFRVLFARVSDVDEFSLAAFPPVAPSHFASFSPCPRSRRPSVSPGVIFTVTSDPDRSNETSCDVATSGSLGPCICDPIARLHFSFFGEPILRSYLLLLPCGRCGFSIFRLCE